MKHFHQVSLKLLLVTTGHIVLIGNLLITVQFIHLKSVQQKCWNLYHMDANKEVGILVGIQTATVNVVS